MIELARRAGRLVPGKLADVAEANVGSHELGDRRQDPRLQPCNLAAGVEVADQLTAGAGEGVGAVAPGGLAPVVTKSRQLTLLARWNRSRPQQARRPRTTRRSRCGLTQATQAVRPPPPTM